MNIPSVESSRIGLTSMIISFDAIFYFILKSYLTVFGLAKKTYNLFKPQLLLR